ncbi:MAG: chloramphenicol acetyltransferase [Rhodothermales bacterium]|nr:chloramphenicol acetyltransferase [Rhodothermales bacterium]
MSRYLDIASWPREQHYRLFREYERPFFTICANVDVTTLKEAADKSERSFFIACLHVSTWAANDVEEFRYRLREDGVWVHDVIHPGSTVLMPDDTFGFAYFELISDFDRFHEAATREVEAVRSGRDAMDPRDDRDDLVHYSVIPWVTFTSFQHARRFLELDSTPKIVFGRYFRDGDRLKMPVSVEVHHALVDGLHVGAYYSRLQKLIDDSRSLVSAGQPDQH